MKALSFDIGVRNMAYAGVVVSEDGAELVVSHWCLHDLGKMTMKSVVNTVVCWLDSSFQVCDWDRVIIENQMTSKMKCIQTVIATYFTVKGCRVELVSATLKYAGMQTLGLTYAQRKKLCVQCVVDSNCEAAATFLKGLKKKDDVCEALMQAKQYCLSNASLSPDHALKVMI